MPYQSINLRGELFVKFMDGNEEQHHDIKSMSVDGQFIVVSTNTGELVAFSQASIRSISLK